MKKQNNAARGMLVTLMGGILWGFSGTCGQYIFQQEAASSQWVTCVRMLGAGVVLIALEKNSTLKKMQASLAR